MALKPLHDRVLVRRVESEEKTAGGLIIPDSAKEKPAEGEIVAAGEGARKDSGELIEWPYPQETKFCLENGLEPK
jgi:chaperonin GroES